MCALENAKEVWVSALEEKSCWGNNTYKTVKGEHSSVFIYSFIQQGLIECLLFSVLGI